VARIQVPQTSAAAYFADTAPAPAKSVEQTVESTDEFFQADTDETRQQTSVLDFSSRVADDIAEELDVDKDALDAAVLAWLEDESELG